MLERLLTLVVSLSLKQKYRQVADIRDYLHFLVVDTIRSDDRAKAKAKAEELVKAFRRCGDFCHRKAVESNKSNELEAGYYWLVHEGYCFSLSEILVCAFEIGDDTVKRVAWEKSWERTKKELNIWEGESEEKV